MEAITPPEEIETEHEQLTTGVREFAEQLNPIINRSRAETGWRSRASSRCRR